MSQAAVFGYPPVPAHGTQADWLNWANHLPLSKFLGVECIELDQNHGEFYLKRSPLILNPTGGLHGGVVAAVIDHAAGVAALPSLVSGDGIATASLNIDYYRSCTVPMRVTAAVARKGRTVVFVRVRVLDTTGGVRAEASGVMSVRAQLEANRLPGAGSIGPINSCS